MNVILLGPPGAGKGTQAGWLCTELGMRYLASGDLLRRHRAAGTELGREAAGYMSAGKLVPDQLVVAIILAEIAADPRGEFLLDGFPRTVAQADSLATAFCAYNLELTAVFLIDTPDEMIEARISGRRQCPDGHVYHVDHDPPQRPGVCDHDGKRLKQRDDDRADVVRERLAIYHADTAPLIAYYERRRLLHRVDGTLAPTEVSAQIRARLGVAAT
jgi:adenylate kinase